MQAAGPSRFNRSRRRCSSSRSEDDKPHRPLYDSDSEPNDDYPTIPIETYDRARRACRATYREARKQERIAARRVADGATGGSGRPNSPGAACEFPAGVESDPEDRGFRAPKVQRRMPIVELPMPPRRCRNRKPKRRTVAPAAARVDYTYVDNPCALCNGRHPTTSCPAPMPPV